MLPWIVCEFKMQELGLKRWFFNLLVKCNWPEAILVLEPDIFSQVLWFRLRASTTFDHVVCVMTRCSSLQHFEEDFHGCHIWKMKNYLFKYLLTIEKICRFHGTITTNMLIWYNRLWYILHTKSKMPLSWSFCTEGVKSCTSKGTIEDCFTHTSLYLRIYISL